MNLNRILSLFLTSEQGFRVGLAVAALFSILVLMSTASLLNGFWSDSKLSFMMTERASVINQASPLQELIDSIPQAHLFGYHSPDMAYMPITSSQLLLTGIIQEGAEEEENSFSKVIISVRGKTGTVFQVGEVLLDGVKITAIQKDAVILDNNGHSERLPLQRAKLRIN
ncbi:MAG TPA: type II secretion system protein N [Gammaproteobacteria bacterium]|nr:type II secretion system protein N [Gammaproteobacteria bacterium]